MSIGHSILMRMFGRPHGPLGWLGGIVMARSNRHHAAWAIELLGVKPNDRVLEIGCGPGVAIQLLAGSAQHVAGIDPSKEMLRQATRRNARAIRDGHVNLQQGSVERLPFADNSFDKALTINSMQVWPDASAGLREIRRVLKPGGSVALAFNSYSGQKKQGTMDIVASAGFTESRLVEIDQAFCVVASAP